MFRTEKREIADFQADYETRADFCKVFENEMKSLYLLAFLLTANHQDAEQCFVSTVNAGFEEQAVFKGWSRSWIKRSLIRHAIQIASPPSGRSAKKRDLWSIGAPGDGEIDAVTQLAPLERIVFVMLNLERYSAWECSLLLRCSKKQVVLAGIRALRELPGPERPLPKTDAMFSPSLQVIA
jgi:DNA-directed RNA polymerase specialized sigma24 family protein